MHRHSLFAPVTTLTIGLIIIVLLFGTPFGQSGASISLAYTAAEETGTAAAYVSPADVAATSTAQAQRTATPATATTAATSAATAATAATAITNTAATSTSAPTTTSAPTVTRVVTAAPATATPIAELVCSPGTPLYVFGEGPAGSGILLLFDERIVSGGVVRANGRWSMQLVVGNEEPGVYPVAVQVRGTNDVLWSKTCLVPAITPTPPPLGRGP